MNPIYLITNILLKSLSLKERQTCSNCGRFQKNINLENFHCLHCGHKTAILPTSKKRKLFVLARQKLLELVFLLLGPVLALIGLKGFLIPNGLIDGGITGISMLLSKVFSIELGLLVFLINIPFIFFAYRFFNEEFAVKAWFSIVILSVLLPFINIPNYTPDKLLDAIFGGFFLGAGIGFSIRGGGVLDGTEILALIISRKFPATVGDSILGFNILIFSFSLMVFPIENILYSILTFFSASKTVDFIMHGIESFNGVMIFSNYSQQLRFAIVNDLKRGVSLIRSRGGYSEKDQEILFCVMTRLEIPKIKTLIEEIDPNAFFIVFPVTDVKGGVVRKLFFDSPTSNNNPQR